ncbi:hypothetical protein CYMTET_6708 [Cymbomonas tetramitiformis]|uniref:Uncharacterized protein n=1 Tax=Cymbomonas tetramitiformis TaxID=36881 RepID=A0AAE0BZT3_9CHLO|nr:hypothetical protein CYMTET_45296 [Cymbomonas tetramitiformis]KAK3285698.1 hypothetical protein CYMTET_6708 [Cymbomonas tetramitiformis]
MVESPVVDDRDRLIQTGKEMSREPSDQPVPADMSEPVPVLGRLKALICQPLLMQLPSLMAYFPARGLIH